MKKIIFCLLLIRPCCCFAQIGIKAGLNFANVTGASSINSKSQTGFHAGVLFSPRSRAVFGSRTELLFTRQGYDYAAALTTGSVKLNYIMLGQFLAVNITRYVQLQVGAQIAVLIGARADSSKPATGNATADKILDYYNRLDYGVAGGIEIHPIKKVLAGARYNISLNNLYKYDPSSSAGSPSFGSSSDNLKNNIVQLFIGYKF